LQGNRAGAGGARASQRALYPGRHRVRGPQGRQRAFEREHFEHSPHRARTDDFLAAISDTKPTLTAEIVSRFDDDTGRVARF
jgi:hypothetical protein